MTLGCHLAAPTLVQTSSGPFLVSRFRLSDYALILTAASDAAGLDDDSGETLDFADPRCIDWMLGPGLPVLLWCALRRGQDGLTVASAAKMGLADHDVAVIVRAALRRSTPKRAKRSGGKDIARGDWGPLFYQFVRAYKRLPAAVGDMTLDQLDNILSGGDDGESAANQAEMQAAWLAMQTAEPEPPKPATLAEELAAMGLSIVPESDVTPETTDA